MLSRFIIKCAKHYAPNWFSLVANKCLLILTALKASLEHDRKHVLRLNITTIMETRLYILDDPNSRAQTAYHCSFEFSLSEIKEKKRSVITHSAGQTYVWHGFKWNFAGPQIYLQPAKIISRHFGVSLKFLVCSWKYCLWRLTVCQNFSLQVCFYRTTSVRNIQISDCVHTVKTIFLQCILLSWSNLTKMSDNSNNVHFSGVRFICSPYLAIKWALASRSGR